MASEGAPGPFSVARTINRETVVLLGWGRAILLQLAHPLVAQGVADHSPFGRGAADYARRAYGTVGAMLRLTFGTGAEARRTAAHINAIHARVSGTLHEPAGIFPAGTRYSAHDPELLLWVHATLVESVPMAYETFVRPLHPDEKNRYCVEAAAAAALLDLPEHMAPQTTQALREYMSDMFERGAIQVTPPARQLAQALLWPPLGPASPLFGLARLVTLGLLPPAIRSGYGYGWSDRQERMFRRVCAIIRGTRKMTPPVLREWPTRNYAREADA
jgi:uncharacterized protein (DUF2236 family)